MNTKLESSIEVDIRFCATDKVEVASLRKERGENCSEEESLEIEKDWLSARPPSSEELHGKLFLGWYQTEDITDYSLAAQYHKQGQIDMKSIIDDIPSFIATCRESLRRRRLAQLPELGKLVEGLYHTDDLHSFAEDIPSFLNDCRRNLIPSSCSTITNSPRNNALRESKIAQHVENSDLNNRPLTHTCQKCNPAENTKSQTLYVMLDYMVEISVPQHLLHHFATFKNKVHSTSPRSRPQSARSRRAPTQRWVFIPCHCDVTDCYGNLFHTLQDFIPIIVVPYERYEQFVSVCAGRYVIVRLPSRADMTTGYANYWIVQIARKLNLEQIWIIDDQVKSFYRSVPYQRLPLHKTGQSWTYNVPLISQRLASFSEVMSHLEERMEMDSIQNPMNPMSIIGFSNEICAQDESYSYNIPIGAILLNIRNLGELKFHPELHQIDTQVLACEAVKAGQRVFVCNSFVLLDAVWDSL